MPDYPHYTVTVEDADYNPSRDAWSNSEGFVTDSAQWWYPYETRKAAVFSNDVPGQETFGPGTYPSSDGYSGPTGIIVTVDSMVEDRLYAYVYIPPSFLLGDANGDGTIEIGDVIYVINYLYKGGSAPDPLMRADVNCDLIVDLGDVIYLLNYLFKNGPEPDC